MSGGWASERKIIPIPLTMLLAEAIENKETIVRLMLTLDRLDRYAAMARPQNERIWEVQRQAQETTNQACLHAEMVKGMLWLEKSWVEAHFYIICWDAVGKAINTIRQNRSGLKAPGNVWKRHRLTLKSYQETRDHLEHWTERLPGGTKDNWRPSSSPGYISGNMGHVRLEQIFTFRNEAGQDKELDISPASVELLEHICKQFKEEMAAELRAILERRRQENRGCHGNESFA